MQNGLRRTEYMNIIIPLTNAIICLGTIGGIIVLYPLAGGWSFVLLIVLSGLMSTKKA